MAVDVEKVLEVLASNNLIRLSRPLGRYYSIYCPFHNNGQERRPSCGVLLQDEVRNGRKYTAGMFHCFTCHYAKSLPEAISDLLKMHNISTSAIDWLKQNVPGFEIDVESFDYLIPRDVVQQINNNWALDYLRNLRPDSNPKYISEEELASYRYCVDYMYQRGLTDELIEKFDIGVDMNYQPQGWKRPVPSITFPVRDIRGNTLFIARRSIEGKFFFLPKDVEKPLYGVYELPNGCKQVLIVESCLNAITAVKYGVPSVALLGTGTPNQIESLRHLGVKEFILGLDPDDAGAKGSRILKRNLRDLAFVKSLEGIPEGKDINDLDYDSFWEIFSNRV